MPGVHRIDLDVQIDTRSSPDVHPIHTERRTLSTTFEEIEPPPSLKLVRLCQDPVHESAHYLSLDCLQTIIRDAPLPLKVLALAEMTRRDDLGELPAAERNALVDDLLTIQADRTRAWSGAFGDYLESLHAAHKLSDANWHRYGRQAMNYLLRARAQIAQGQQLPLEIVELPLRGNSRHGNHFSASEWTLHRFEYDGVTQFIRLTNWDGGTGEDIPAVPNSGAEYGHRKNAVLPQAELGRHTLGATLTLTWLDPDVAQAIKLPVNFDLGRVEFSVVPQAENRIRLVDDPAMATQISRCITITTPLHWPDETVTTFIEMHHSPVDVAFDVFLDVGGREWKLGQISAPQGGDSDLSHSSFSVRDGMHVPASGLHFRFRSNPSLALRSVALRACWQGELTLEPQPDRR